MDMVLDARQDVVAPTLKHENFVDGTQRSELEAGPCRYNYTGETKHYFKMDFTFLYPKGG